MRISRNKTTATTIALFLMLFVAATLVTLPAAYAHDPPWDIPSWSFAAVAPQTIGVNQEVLITFWPNVYPHTAQGAYGDRFTWYVEITKPDTTKETLGPFTSDPVGGGWALYTPTQVGTYTIVSKKPAHTYNGQPYNPRYTTTQQSNYAYWNDTVAASESEPVQLYVTEQQVPKYVDTPLPDGYWSRPIYGANRDWYQVAGNWLGGAAQVNGSTTNYAYGEGPESAHVLWSRSFWSGGIMDTRTGSIGYYTGLSYEGYGSIDLIVEGKLYYDVQTPPRQGHYCLDLYSGEVVWYRNTTGPVSGISTSGFAGSGSIPYGDFAYGQIYNYESPNQHGGFPYLWVTDTGKSNTWDMHDAYTGDYICSIANVSSGGTAVYGKDGSILRYSLQNYGTSSNPKYYLRVWNTSRAIWYQKEFSTNVFWMWRPNFNQTFDGNNGFSTNVSVPLTHSTTIRAVLEGEYIIGGASGSNTEAAVTQGHMWCLSLKPGQEGTLMWNITFTPPKSAPAVALQSAQFANTVVTGPNVYPEEGVFMFEQSLTRERWCYSLETGQQLWASKPEAQYNFYGMSDFVYNGRFYSFGYSGELLAYNIKTGKIDWNWSAPDEGLGETFYQHSPLSLGVIADGKAYMYTSEHSPTMPLRRDANIWCVDLETGKLIWKMSCWASGPKIADGRLVTFNQFDNAIYCYGKGSSATTVAASPDVSVHGSSVLIKGTVTDQTPSGKLNTNGGLDFTLKGTPAIADEDQEAWMEYLFQQRPIPATAKGVEVTLDALDPNGNFVHIGTVTSDMTGNYGYAFTPEVPGLYTVIATFAGSKSYGSSFAQTYLNVDEAPPATAPPEYPQPIDYTMHFVYVAIAIIITIVVVGILLFRKK